MKDVKMIYVEWVDSSHSSGWVAAEDAIKLAGDFKCRTVGFLLVETDEHLTVVQTHTEDVKQVDGVMTIPKVAITKRKYL